MPSTDDFFHQLQAINSKLGHLVTLSQYADLALSQNAKQNDTIICILEHISKNTCELLNQSVVQTKLQTEMQKDIDALEASDSFIYSGSKLVLFEQVSRQ